MTASVYSHISPVSLLTSLLALLAPLPPSQNKLKFASVWNSYASPPFTAGGKQIQWMAPPQQTIPGCPPGLEYLTQVDQLLVNQQVELFESTFTTYCWLYCTCACACTCTCMCSKKDIGIVEETRLGLQNIKIHVYTLC